MQNELSQDNKYKRCCESSEWSCNGDGLLPPTPPNKSSANLRRIYEERECVRVWLFSRCVRCGSRFSSPMQDLSHGKNFCFSIISESTLAIQLQYSTCCFLRRVVCRVGKQPSTTNQPTNHIIYYILVCRWLTVRCAVSRQPADPLARVRACQYSIGHKQPCRGPDNSPAVLPGTRSQQQSTTVLLLTDLRARNYC